MERRGDDYGDEDDGDEESGDDYGDEESSVPPIPRAALPSPTLPSPSNLFVPAPLPLMNFQLDINDIQKARTISGEEIKTFRNTFLEPESQAAEEDNRLQDPCYTRCLVKWFTARSQREVLVRQSDGFSLSATMPPLAPLLSVSPLRRSESDGNLDKPTGATTTNNNSNSSSSPIEPLLDWPVYSRRSFVADKQSDAKLLCTCGARSREQNSLLPDTAFNTTRNNASDDASRKADNVPRASSNSPPVPLSQYCPLCQAERSLTFDSCFESGNLERATRIENRDGLMTAPRAMEFLQKYVVPGEVDQEYDLLLQKDVYTSGNIQWFYFSAAAPPESTNGTGAKYPLRVRFNLVNMQKSDSLYTVGMKPALLSMNRDAKGWQHGGTDVCYFKNGLTSVRGGTVAASDGADDKKPQKKLKQYYSLCFTYTFTEPDTVFFAHSYPYTYSDLQAYLLSLQLDDRVALFTRRKLLCNTLAGNRCDVLTITARCSDAERSASKPAIVISARIHPGETNSSLAMHGFIEFLISKDPEAVSLREHFVFKIVPMLNPDGVIHGNYRCSLAGTDLNRRYNDMYPYIYPTVVAMKGLLEATQKKRGVLLFLDLHGHSKNKNAFVYGCDLLQIPEKQLRSILPRKSSGDIATQRIFARVFPKMLATVSNAFDRKKKGYFSYQDSTFSVKKSKFGTGRVVSWRQLEIEGSYTIEISFCGVGNNEERRLLKKIIDGKMRQAGAPDGVCESLPGVLSFCSKTAGISEADIAMLADLESLYSQETHFSKRNLQELGEHIGRTLFQFANLQYAEEPPAVKLSSTKIPGPTAPASLPQTLWATVTPESKRRDHEMRKIGADLFCEANPPPPELRFGQNPNVTSHGSALLKKPLLGPYLFSGEAFLHALSSFPDEFQSSEPTENLSARFKCEQEMRKFLGLEYTFRSRSPSVAPDDIVARSSSGTKLVEQGRSSDSGSDAVRGASSAGAIMSEPTCMACDAFIINFDAQFESADDGSDSDPSVDNVPVSKMTKDMGKYQNPEALLRAIRLAEQKKHSKDVAAEKAHAACEAKRKKEAQQELQEEAVKRQARLVAKGKGASDGKAKSYTMTTKKAAKHTATLHVPVYRMAETRGNSPVLIQISTMEANFVAGLSTSTASTPSYRVGGGGLYREGDRPTSVQSFLESLNSPLNQAVAAAWDPRRAGEAIASPSVSRQSPVKKAMAAPLAENFRGGDFERPRGPTSGGRV